jgi:hypothetical protein
MLYYSKYAEQKIDILQKHGVFIRKEEIEECLALPDKSSKKGKYLSARKGNLKVVFKKSGEIKKVITFFPIKKEI